MNGETESQHTSGVSDRRLANQPPPVVLLSWGGAARQVGVAQKSVSSIVRPGATPLLSTAPAAVRTEFLQKALITTAFKLIITPSLLYQSTIPLLFSIFLQVNI